MNHFLPGAGGEKGEKKKKKRSRVLFRFRLRQCRGREEGASPGPLRLPRRGCPGSPGPGCRGLPPDPLSLSRRVVKAGRERPGGFRSADSTLAALALTISPRLFRGPWERNENTAGPGTAGAGPGRCPASARSVAAEPGRAAAAGGPGPGRGRQLVRSAFRRRPLRRRRRRRCRRPARRAPAPPAGTGVLPAPAGRTGPRPAAALPCVPPGLPRVPPAPAHPVPVSS